MGIGRPVPVRVRIGGRCAVVATAVMAPTKCLARRFVRNFFIKDEVRAGRSIDGL